MPIHDWTRVDPCIFHDFHLAWIGALRTALNSGSLPPRFYALIEQFPGDADADVIALHTPRVGIRNGHRQRSVVVRHESDHRALALIEIIAPGNKELVRGIKTF